MKVGKLQSSTHKLRDQPQSASQPLLARATLAFGEGPKVSQVELDTPIPRAKFSVSSFLISFVTAIILKSLPTFILFCLPFFVLLSCQGHQIHILA